MKALQFEVKCIAEIIVGVRVNDKIKSAIISALSGIAGVIPRYSVRRCYISRKLTRHFCMLVISMPILSIGIKDTAAVSREYFYGYINSATDPEKAVIDE